MAITPINVLFIQGGGTISASEIPYRDQMTSQGHTVTGLAAGSVNQTVIDANDFVLWSHSSSAVGSIDWTVQTKHMMGMKAFRSRDALNMAVNAGFAESKTSTTIIDDTHPIATGFANGTVELYNTAQAIQYLVGTYAGGLEQISTTTAGVHLSVVEIGGALSDGGTTPSPSRRVNFPAAENVAASEITADHMTLFQQAFDYAAFGEVAGNNVPGEFANPGYDNTATLVEDEEHVLNPLLVVTPVPSGVYTLDAVTAGVSIDAATGVVTIAANTYSADDVVALGVTLTNSETPNGTTTISFTSVAAPVVAAKIEVILSSTFVDPNDIAGTVTPITSLTVDCIGTKDDGTQYTQQATSDAVTGLIELNGLGWTAGGWSVMYQEVASKTVLGVQHHTVVSSIGSQLLFGWYGDSTTYAVTASLAGSPASIVRDYLVAQNVSASNQSLFGNGNNPAIADVTGYDSTVVDVTGVSILNYQGIGGDLWSCDASGDSFKKTFTNIDKVSIGFASNNYGVARYRVDAGAWSTFDGNVGDPSDLVEVEIVLPSVGDYTIEISHDSGGSIYFDYIKGYNTEDDVIMLPMAARSFQTSDFVSSGGQGWRYLGGQEKTPPSIDMDALIINLGINDVLQSQVEATYTANMTTLLDSLVAAYPSLTLILVIPHEISVGLSYIPSVVTTLAATYSATLLDCRTAPNFADYATANGAGLMADVTHPNTAGYAAIWNHLAPSIKTALGV